jgi:hypothetical protein
MIYMNTCYDYNGEYEGIRDETVVTNFEDYSAIEELNKATKCLRMTILAHGSNCKPASSVWESIAPNGNASDLYLGGCQFESRPGHRVS